MNDVRDWLKDGDPVVNELPLSDADLLRMRRAIVTAGESRESSFSDWARGSWAAATVAIALLIAVGMSRWTRPAEEAARSVTPGSAATSAAPETVTRRQVQLIAPGGTRVIWIFNADFNP